MKRASLAPLLLAPVAIAVALALQSGSLAQAPRVEAGPPALAEKLDELLESAARGEGIEPAPAISDLALLRRVSLDVLGTVPSLEEIRSLEADRPEGRRGRLLERILSDPRAKDELAERLARVAVGTSVRAANLEDALFYRRRRLVAWLTEQVEARRPWDEIVRALVASEGVVTDTPQVNFLAAVDADPIKLAGRSARAFLGVRLDCAQCHDHPFAQWKQSDFEGLAAFFARADRRGPFVRDKKEGELSIEDGKKGMRHPQPAVPFAHEAMPEAGGSRRDQFARWLTDPRNPYFARSFVNRVWSWLMGRGLVEPVDELDQGSPEKSLVPVLALLERDFLEHRMDIDRLVRAIVSTRAYARSSVPLAARNDRARALHAVAWVKPLHADHLARSLYQATNMWTYDERRHFLVRLERFGESNKFMQRHGEDLDADRLEGPTLLRRLLLMNGQMIEKRISKEDGPGSVQRAGQLAPDAKHAIEVLYLMALTRRPSPAELAHFEARFAAALVETKNDERARRSASADLAWALVNSTEFSWNQ